MSLLSSSPWQYFVVVITNMLMTFIPPTTSYDVNIMSLANIATRERVDDVRCGAQALSMALPGADRQRTILDALKEVGRPTFFSLLLVTVSFIPTLTVFRRSFSHTRSPVRGCRALGTCVGA